MGRLKKTYPWTSDDQQSEREIKRDREKIAGTPTATEPRGDPRRCGGNNWILDGKGVRRPNETRKRSLAPGGKTSKGRPKETLRRSWDP